MSINPHPHDLRVMAREATYPNRTVEDQTVAAVDRAVFDKVRVFERGLIADAQTHLDTGTELTRRARDLDRRIVDEVLDPLAKPGAVVTPEIAKRYRVLMLEAQDLEAKLNLQASASHFYERRVSDPYAAYTDLLDNWPQIRPVIIP